MHVDLDRLESRLSRLERELRFWRALAIAVAAASAAASCDAPSEQLSELVLASSDGTHHVRVTATGIVVESEGRTASMTSDGITVQHEQDLASLDDQGLLLASGEQTRTSIRGGSVSVAGGTGRASLSVEGDTTGFVTASGGDEAYRVQLMASDESAGASLRGRTTCAVLASAGASAAGVTVVGEDGATHTYGPFDAPDPTH